MFARYLVYSWLIDESRLLLMSSASIRTAYLETHGIIPVVICHYTTKFILVSNFILPLTLAFYTHEHSRLVTLDRGNQGHAHIFFHVYG